MRIITQNAPLLLRAAMTRQGLTNKALAARAGVSVSLIDKLRNNKRRPGSKARQRIETALNAYIWSSPSKHQLQEVSGTPLAIAAGARGALLVTLTKPSHSFEKTITKTR